MLWLRCVQTAPRWSCSRQLAAVHPQMTHEWLWTSGGVILTEQNRSTLTQTCPVPFCPPQIPHRLPWMRTQASAVRGQRITTWATARLCSYLNARDPVSHPYKTKGKIIVHFFNTCVFTQQAVRPHILNCVAARSRQIYLHIKIKQLILKNQF
jgi:hypothetical protein